MAAVWLDVTRCTGCGACVAVCPTGALTLVADRASLDTALCRGCEVCVQACPVGALRPVVEMTPVPVPAQVVERAPATAPAAPRAGLLATAIAAGTQLVVQAAPLVLQAVEQWLTRSRGSAPAPGHALTAGSRLGGGGRQIRLRQRGRR